MQKINKLRLVMIILMSQLILTGCGMIPAAGLLVDEQQPSIFLVNSDNYPVIKKNLSKKMNLADKPEQADFLVSIRSSKRSLLLDIIGKKGNCFTTEYQLTTGNDQVVIAASIARLVLAMPWLSRRDKIQTKAKAEVEI